VVAPKDSSISCGQSLCKVSSPTQQSNPAREELSAMNCPFCKHDDSRVVDSRVVEDGLQIRRRRECPECGQRFSTQETTILNIIKRSGVSEAFSRAKVINGVRKACQGRPVSEDDLARLASSVEETLRKSGQADIDAHEVGLAILAPLKELDAVAYLRFASVYRNFTSLADFESEISLLREFPPVNISEENSSNGLNVVTPRNAATK